MLIKKPIKGTKDILPKEMRIREYIYNIILDSYKSFGFSQIETPILENIENLSSKQGGDNEKLIFKTLKRGEKLDLASAKDEEDLVDSGLRYDLTLPLARYYSNNSSNLNLPFKAIQIGNVFRAERPQKGRYRQFVQCDIDILGEEGNIAEIELINATCFALSRVFEDRKYILRINDRKILRAMALYAGFSEENLDKVFIILDKMDKISLDGVKAELLTLIQDEEKVEKYLSLFSNSASLVELKDILKAHIKEEEVESLFEIITSVKTSKIANFEIVFDPSLVRGMGYYTDTIFEISMEGFNGSVAGGGRYNKMISKFINNDCPACGFSIGFERIVNIFSENNYKIKNESLKKVYLYEKNIDKNILLDIIKKANEERKAGNIVSIVKMNKNKKFQKTQLEEEGYTEFVEIYKEKLR